MPKLFHRQISGPFTIPSGVVTTEIPVLEKIAQEIPEIGILTTKSIGLLSKQGNPEPILAYHSSFSFVNAVGLRNSGAEEFAKKLSKVRIPKNKFLLISIFGKNPEEFKRVAQTLFNYADGFELNISCPHSEGYGQTIGQDLVTVKQAVKAVAELGKPVLVKISPNLDISATIKAAAEGGMAGVTAINTKGPAQVLYDNEPVLSNKIGGVSGKALLETGIESVKQIRQMGDWPIIACGGISSSADVLRYQKTGADFFGIGSALAGMSTQEMKNYFSSLLQDIEQGTNLAESFLKSNEDMKYQKFKIAKNTQIAPDLFFLECDRAIEARPGQYVFAWLPRKGERPFSVFEKEPLSLLVKKRGCFTQSLTQLQAGGSLYVRGPYGNAPKIQGKILLVGGGTGIAALYLFARENPETIAVLGAKSKNHLMQEKFQDKCSSLYFFTEDGLLGRKGQITDDLTEIIKKEKPEYCINCGPRPMIEKLIPKQKQFFPEDKIFSSIEFITRCGKGLCGACATEKGYRSCVDGTFLHPNQIK
jgi:dihydroorotate dehydrogenase subfamily 1